MEPSIVKRLLPPVTPLVRSRIHSSTNTGSIQHLDRSIITILTEIRHTGLVRIASLGEAGYVLLHRDCNGWNGDRGSVWLAYTRVVRVGNILAVDGWEDGVEIAVGLVAKGLVEVERVACSDVLASVRFCLFVARKVTYR